ncbi:MAG: carboxylate-amine ligase [Solirubrobacteraceae bacterium]
MSRLRGGLPEWAEWKESWPYTLGIEEEVMLLDPERDWALAQRIDDVLAAIPGQLAQSVSAETHQSVIELMTRPHESVAAAASELARLRRDLVDVLAQLGLAAAAAGTHPLAEWSDTEVTEARRYQQIHRTMRDLVTREPTFALHVHVGVRSGEEAIELYNRMRVHLPMLLALSGNSPFWRGRDAGFCSTRTFLFQAFPRTGMPRRYSSYEEWVERVDLQIRSGALHEPTFLWWDVRPQPALGTVEVRVMDAQSRIEDSAALAALVQSIARLELEEGYVSDEVIKAEEVLDENRFIAARDGVDACLIDTTAESLRPIGDLLAQLLEVAHPHAIELGCGDELARVQALAASPGAARQRAYPADEAGLVRMVASLSAAFARAD